MQRLNRLKIRNTLEDITPIFSTKKSKKTSTILHANSIVSSAIKQYKTESARIEYCDWYGINYENTIKYAKTIIALEKLYQPEKKILKPKPIKPIVRGDPVIDIIGDPDGKYTLYVRIEGMSEEEYAKLKNAGKCPLCCQSHNLSKCPHLPDELRPFC